MATTVETPRGIESDRPPGGPQSESVTELLSGIINDAQTLVRQQAEMLTAELREDFKSTARAAQFGAVGVVFTTVGVLGLTTALAYLLHEHYAIEMWVSWGIVGGVAVFIGLGSTWISHTLLQLFNPLPDKTFNALKEQYTWKTRS